MKRILATFLFILIIQVAGYSQQYHFKIYQTKNGLAGSSINQIVQDSKGFLWFATQGGGVSRFDGKVFKNYAKADGLIGNDVTAICEDKQGNIWIATSSGVSRFDGLRFTNFTSKNGLGDNLVYSVYLDSKGVLWMSTFGGVTRYDGTTFSTLTTKEGLPTNEILCVVEDHEGVYWIGTNAKGLCKYDGKSVVTYTTKDGLSNNSVFCLREDARKQLWIGTAGGGVSVKNKNRFIVPASLTSIRNDFIGSIVEDQRKNIWIATEHGLVKYGGKGSQFITAKEGLPVNSVQALCVDYEGNLWIGTFEGGVSLFKNEAVVNYFVKDGLINSNVQSIFQVSDGNYLVGTVGSGTSNPGLVYYNQKEFKVIPGKEFIGNSITWIREDKAGLIWIGLNENGIAVLKKSGDTYKIVKTYPSLNNVKLKPVVQIIQDKKGVIWVATYGTGVFTIDKDKIIRYTAENGLTSNDILSLYEDKKGAIWIGTFQAGLISFDGHAFKHYNTSNGLADNTINSISEDQQGRLLLGTAEGGISVFQGNTFHSFSVKDGLTSNLIKVVSYKNGYLWAGTDKGLHRIKIRDNNTIEDLRIYGEQKGLNGTEICMLWDKHGMLWLGTSEGLTRYNPSLDYSSKVPQKILLTGIRLFYQKADWNKYGQKAASNSDMPIGLNLSYKNNHLTFDYQALTTDNVQYTFMLEGLDQGWSPLTTNTEAVYSNIPPGDNYTFKVKAISSDGVWTENVATYTFNILAPFWQTWWFYLLCLMVVVIGSVGYTRIRTIKLQQSKQLLEKQVKERTMEIQEKNSMLELAFTDIKASIEYAKRIQYAILPKPEDIMKTLPDSFILYKPRDIVSGDFYWYAQSDARNKLEPTEIIIAAADCTGHGVPGAFMSIIGNTILNEIVNNIGITKPSDILDHLHVAVRQALKQETGETRDGMDIALCKIDLKKNSVEYAGAMRPLWIVKNNGELSEIKADKQAIGGLESDGRKLFTNHEIELASGDCIYMSTDGYADQFGGLKEKKFMVRNFQKILIDTNILPKSQQQERLREAFLAWKGQLPQLDDVLVIGIRL